MMDDHVNNYSVDNSGSANGAPLAGPASPTAARNLTANTLNLDDAFSIDGGQSPYHSLRVDPIAAKSINGNRNLLKTGLWVLLSTTLLAGVGGSVAWYNFDKFVQYPQLRSFYSIACNFIGCALPDLEDISKVKSQNLVVRSHPSVKNSLIIEAVIVNKAAFDQPFPRLGLHFSDINNNIVAEKIFTPQEYLSGEAKGMSKMPINTQVRLVIEIRDPGAQAVNYSISFHKAIKD
jgi:hypothetical protein